jgi:hypothetical protein
MRSMTHTDSLHSTCGQVMLLTALALPSSSWPFCFNTCASSPRRPLRPLRRAIVWHEGAFGLLSSFLLCGALHSSCLHYSPAGQSRRTGTRSWKANVWAGVPKIRMLSSRCGPRMPRLTCSSMSSSSSSRCPSLGYCGSRARAEWDSSLSSPWARCECLQFPIFAFANLLPVLL